MALTIMVTGPPTCRSILAHAPAMSGLGEGVEEEEDEEEGRSE